MLPGKTIGDQLDYLERTYPRRSRVGWLHRPESKPDAKNSATIFLYMRSSDNTYHVHESDFRSYKKKRTPDEWASWLKTHAFKGTKITGTAYETLGVIKGAIIPAINLKTSLQWKVVEFLGFTTHDIQLSSRSETHSSRHKAKPQRRKIGQDNIRRGHRNRKRKA